MTGVKIRDGRTSGARVIPVVISRTINQKHAIVDSAAAAGMITYLARMYPVIDNIQYDPYPEYSRSGCLSRPGWDFVEQPELLESRHGKR